MLQNVSQLPSSSLDAEELTQLVLLSAFCAFRFVICCNRFRARMEAEKLARLKLVHSFGTLGVSNSSAMTTCAAETVFNARAVNGYARISDLRLVFYELGYWLGAEFEFARTNLDVAAVGEFSFRDLVAWWAQSSRSFLMLFDDAAFKLRSEYTYFYFLFKQQVFVTFFC